MQGKESLTDSESNLYVLTGALNNYTFIFRFCFKQVFSPVSTMGTEIGSRFGFSVFNYRT